MPDFRTPLGRLRIAGLIEGTTLVALLFVAVPLKHLAEVPGLVTVVGPAHGVAFILYIVTLIENFAGGGWTPRDMLRTALAAIIPFGTFFNDRRLRQRNNLAVQL
jgi:integral membrane protein